MAIIQSGATADLMTVDPTSKAARVTLYNSSGVEIRQPPSGSYMAPINVRQTSAAAANVVVWNMRNPAGSAKTVYIRKISLSIAFDGTASAGITLRYKLLRYNTGTYTGGTNVPVIKKATSMPATAVTDIAFLDTGLTAAGGPGLESEFLVIGIPASVTSGIGVTQLDFANACERDALPVLVAGEGLQIALQQAAIIGQTVGGCVEWDER